MISFRGDRGGAAVFFCCGKMVLHNGSGYAQDRLRPRVLVDSRDGSSKLPKEC